MNLTEYIQKNYDKRFQLSDLPFEVVTKTIKKGTVIHAYGEVNNKSYFLNEGIVETTVLSQDLEKTLTFYFPNSFFSSFASSMTGSPSKVQSTALTDVIAEEYSFEAYQKACESSILVCNVARKELEKSFMKKNQREIDFLTKTSEEMYLDLVESSPEILQNIPLKKIANYFGILPETLSRIRKRVTS